VGLLPVVLVRDAIDTACPSNGPVNARHVPRRTSRLYELDLSRPASANGCRTGFTALRRLRSVFSNPQPTPEEQKHLQSAANGVRGASALHADELR
jgi:hypothetical protein